jgi:hypothetical protein
VTVPAKYYFDSNAPFRTHSFESRILVLSNEDTLINRKVTKSDFRSFLDTSLQDYGLLIFPNVNFSRPELVVNYSISIPLTDVGIGVRLIANEKGLLRFEQ